MCMLDVSSELWAEILKLLRYASSIASPAVCDIAALGGKKRELVAEVRLTWWVYVGLYRFVIVSVWLFKSRK